MQKEFQLNLLIVRQKHGMAGRKKIALPKLGKKLGCFLFDGLVTQKQMALVRGKSGLVDFA
jgi:hypothetical protein